MQKPTLASLIGLAISTQLFAATDIQQDNVVVTASRFKDEMSANPSVRVISHEDIENSPSISTADILRSQAGINVESLYGNSGTDATVDMRGFGDSAVSNTLVLIDGQRLNSPDSSNIQWAAIPAKAIDHIEIMSGDGTILYGDRAAGGIINIITDKSGKEAGSITATAGSYGYKSIDGFLSGSFNENGYFNTFIHSSDENGYRRNSAFRAYSITGTAGLNLQKGNAFVDYSVYHVENGMPGVITQAQYDTDPRLTRHKSGGPVGDGEVDLLHNNQTKEGVRIRPGFTYSFNPNLEFSNEFLIAHDSYHFNNPDFYQSVMNRDIDTFGFTPKIKWKSELVGYQNELISGFDYYYGKFNNQSNGILSYTPYYNYTADAKQITQSVYFSDKLSLSEKLNATFGWRTEQIKQSASRGAYDAGYYNRDPSYPPVGLNSYPVNAADGSNKSTQNAYQIGLNYHDGNWGAYTKSGTNFRFANLDELFGYDDYGAITYSGGFLKPQTGRNNEIGLSYKESNLNAKFALFRNNLHNEIYYDYYTNYGMGNNINLDPTRHEGLEAHVGYQLTSILKLVANYSYTEATFTKGQYSGNYLPSVPKHLGNLQATLDENMYGKYSAQLNYVGSRYFTNDYANEMPKLHSYLTLDLKASWNIKPVTVSLLAMNVTDKKYSPTGVSAYGDLYYYPANPRTLYLSMSYDFK